jgi:hypothetical protein
VVQLLKILIQAGLWLFCNKIHLKNKRLFKTKGPLLIIANHPNSFLDALIIGSYYKRRVYFLARGDAFKKPIHRFLLESLNMIPVYRLREGKEFLHLNDYAFSRSIQLLSNGNAVLIFIEGICVNSNELQPFKKGTARILEGIQKQNINPTIHIAGIAFNQFRGIGKIVNLVVSEITTVPEIQNSRDRVLFNKIVFDQLKNNTVFFDSVLFSVLLFAYPLFLFILFLVLKLFQFPTTIILIILVAVPIIAKGVQE